MVRYALSNLVGLTLAAALAAIASRALAEVTYDDLTPKQKAWVDEQIAKENEANRCKAGLFEQYYQECILDRMPNAKNPIAVGSVMQSCTKSAPCRYSGPKKTGIVFNTTAAECFKKYGYNVTLPMAAANIYAACHDLYPGD